jgi:hypothetical protein
LINQPHLHARRPYQLSFFTGVFFSVFVFVFRFRFRFALAAFLDGART